MERRKEIGRKGQIISELIRLGILLIVISALVYYLIWLDNRVYFPEI